MLALSQSPQSLTQCAPGRRPFSAVGVQAIRRVGSMRRGDRSPIPHPLTAWSVGGQPKALMRRTDGGREELGRNDASLSVFPHWRHHAIRLDRHVALFDVRPDCYERCLKSGRSARVCTPWCTGTMAAITNQPLLCDRQPQKRTTARNVTVGFWPE